MERFLSVSEIKLHKLHTIFRISRMHTEYKTINLLQLRVCIPGVQEVQTWKETCPLLMRLWIWALPMEYIYNTNRL